MLDYDARHSWRSLRAGLVALSIATACVLTTPLGAADRFWLEPDGAGIAQTPVIDKPAAQQEAVQPAPTVRPSDQEIEQFLLNAKVVKTKSAPKGVTGTTRATLSDGTITHDASIQTIDEEKAKFESMAGTEFNFKDSWKFNVAGYRLDRLIGLNMVPVSVPRRLGNHMGAYTWWIDDVMMDEGERLKKKLVSPDADLWNEQMRLVRVFDQLIFNVDRNLTNLLITKDWRIWAIDHSRAFRLHHQLMSAANLTYCDRQLLERMKALDRPTLDTAMRDFLTGFEVEAILARRDAIVTLFQSKGPSALFDRRPLPQKP
jgi:hypothetical protein